MKIIYTLGVVALIATASTAQANDNAYPAPAAEQRSHNQAEYWQGQAKNSSGAAQKSSTSEAAVTPAQRLAKSNAEYFAGKVSASNTDAVAKNSDYDFASTQQRIAKSNYEYFKK